LGTGRSTRTEHDTGLRRESGEQELRAEWADLLFRKIDHADDLATDELLGRVQLGDLRAGLAFSVRAEINPDLAGRMTCLRKRFDAKHGSDHEADPLELVPAEWRPIR
jgi:hypothetical protein